MATVLGSGTALATGWLLDPVSTVRLKVSEPVPEPPAPVEIAPVDLPETLDLLARVAWLLRSSVPGLTMPELRALLGEATDSLQRALAAGLRTKRLRRVGAHSKLRYMLNA